MAIKQDDTQPKSDMATMPVVLAVADDFAVFNFDSLLPESASCDYHELNSQLEASARSSDETQKSVYELFKAICSFHFRADDPVQPWGQYGVVQMVVLTYLATSEVNKMTFFQT
ncbi:TPA: hypothetical protein L8S89_002532 [Klebsiella pneumoniae]|nr:hypothetical protein [Klebsiella pneumoniae]